MTEILLVLFTVILTAYVALPMIFSNQSDPLPDLHDPVLQDLDEERDALFHAILEPVSYTHLTLPQILHV